LGDDLIAVHRVDGGIAVSVNGRYGASNTARCSRMPSSGCWALTPFVVKGSRIESPAIFSLTFSSRRKCQRPNKPEEHFNIRRLRLGR